MLRTGAAFLVSLVLLLGPGGSAGAGDGSGELVYAAAGDIWVANANGSAARRLTSTGVEATPVWSPDGSTLAFVSYRDDPTRARSGLYLMSGDGGDVRRLAAADAVRFLEAPGWSPDGTQLAIVAIRGTSSDVLLVAADGSGARWLTDSQLQERDVQWVGPDRLVYGAFDGIFEVATSGGPPRSLVPGAWAPSLSPDRSRLAYVAWRGDLRTLHVADAAGRNPRAFRTVGEHAEGPLAWSPDGTRIVFTGQFSLGWSRYGEGFADHLWLLEPASGSLRRLTGDPDDPRVPGLAARYGHASWWPGGERLFLQPSPGALFVIDANGLCGQRQSGFGGAVGPLSWHPGARPAPAPLRCADLRVRAAFAKAQVGAEQQLNLEVTVWNAGNEAAAAVRVRLDPLTNARALTAFSPNRRCEGSLSVPSCDLGELQAGERARLSFTLAAGHAGTVLADVVTATSSPEALQQTVSVRVGATSYACRIVGSWGNDVLRGTQSADTICAFTGADRIDGLGGNDRIEAGNGDDTVTGGRGRDTIAAAGGRDVIVVRDGERDIVRCGSERDTVLADRKDSVTRDCERVLRR